MTLSSKALGMIKKVVDSKGYSLDGIVKAFKKIAKKRKEIKEEKMEVN